MVFSDEHPDIIGIRKMVPADVPAVAAMDRASDPDAWTENIFRRELQVSLSHNLVAVGKTAQGDWIAGFIVFWMAADELQLHKIVVSPQARRRGVARRLFQAMTDQALACGLSRATLEVRRANESAIKLYEAFGYRVAAVRKGYYVETGEDALIMCARLRPAPVGAV